jgi:hypothetical protein
MYSSSGAEADRLDLVEIFQEKFMEEYKKQYTSNNKQHYPNNPVPNNINPIINF